MNEYVYNSLSYEIDTTAILAILLKREKRSPKMYPLRYIEWVSDEAIEQNSCIPKGLD